MQQNTFLKRVFDDKETMIVNANELQALLRAKISLDAASDSNKLLISEIAGLEDDVKESNKMLNNIKKELESVMTELKTLRTVNVNQYEELVILRNLHSKSLTKQYVKLDIKV